MAMEPSQAELLAELKMTTRAGMFDPRDPAIAIAKTENKLSQRKGVPRRFVPGHTMFPNMTELPVLRKANMTRISPAERKRIFRGVQPSDKYNPGHQSHHGLPQRGSEVDGVATPPWACH